MKKELIKILKVTMVATVIIICVLLMSTLLYIRQDKFGKSPSGTRLKRIKGSPNFKSGSFQNQSKTPTLTEGHNYFEVIYEAYFKNKPRHYPSDIITSVKT